MNVRDLIYLLKTRGKPEDEIIFVGYPTTSRGLVADLSACADSDFLTIDRDEEKEECHIWIGQEFTREIENFAKGYHIDQRENKETEECEGKNREEKNCDDTNKSKS